MAIAGNQIIDHWALARAKQGGKGVGQQGQTNQSANPKGKGIENSTTGKQIDVTKYKTTICRFWKESRCNKGNQCNFAHGTQEQVILSTWPHTTTKGKGKPTATVNIRPIGAPGSSTGQLPWPSLGLGKPPPQPQAAAAVGGGGGGGSEGLPMPQQIE